MKKQDNSAMLAYKQALKMDKPSIQLEGIIAQSAMYSYLYSCNKLNDRFFAGEVSIALNAKFAYKYAKTIVNGRFYLAETIIRESRFRLKYRRRFIM